MRQFDFSPLYRSTIGFDRLFNMIDSFSPTEGSHSYPPYNIERLSDNSYRISMAIAGFSEEELDISVCRNQIAIKGEKQEEADKEDREFLYRGIASRSFERKFQLADHMEVTGAQLVNGLLHIDIIREIPPEMKTRKIEVKIGQTGQNSNNSSAHSSLKVEKA